MARLSRKLRVCKWIGTVGCVLIAAEFVVSGSWLFFGRWTPGMDVVRGKAFVQTADFNSYVVRLYRGYFDLSRDVVNNTCNATQWEVYGGNSEWFVFHEGLLPRLSYWGHPGLLLPLWLPFLALLLPTLWLWRRDRRKPRPGFCPVCDYNLTGNTTARCPECGTSCQPARDGAPPHAG